MRQIGAFQMPSKWRLRFQFYEMNSLDPPCQERKLIVCIKSFDCLFQVSQLQGVLNVQEPHFWTLSSNYFVGGLKLEVSSDADAKYIVSHTQMIFRYFFICCLVNYYSSFRKVIYLQQGGDLNTGLDQYPNGLNQWGC